MAAALTLCGCRQRVHTPPAPPPIPVVAAEILVRDQPIFADYIGQTHGSSDVAIRARVEAFVEAVHFTEGRPVSSNALLYTLDDRPFRAALAQAEGALAQADALWDKARRDTNRLGPLWLQNAVSRQQFDDALAAERNAAAVRQSAQAAVVTANIHLGYTRIHAPLDGLAGKSEVDVGNLAGGGGNTLLTTISDIDPIALRFSVSEQQYLEWRRHLGEGTRSPTAPRELFQLILADGTVHPHRGTLTFADRQVDPQTGTLMLEATFLNPDQWVRPGQFGRVRFPITVVTNALLVPQRAVSEMQATYSVYVVGPDQRAEFRKIQPGPRVGAFYVVTNGLHPGERVVVEGLQKLQPGALVAPTLTNLVADLPELNPPAR